MKILKYPFIIFGIFLVLDGIIVAFNSNLNIGNALTVLVGAFLIFCAVYDRKIKEKTQKGFAKMLKIIVICGICFCVGLTIFLSVYGNIDTVTYDEDVVIVLGAGINGEIPTQPLAARLDKAVEYLEKNKTAYAIVTGGQGPQEDITEAEAMTRYLVAHGIQRFRILQEDKSTSTSENYKFSKKILDEKLGTYTAATITNDFHIYRAKQLAKIEDIDTSVLHAPTPWYSASIMYIREWLAVIKLWVLKY